MSEKNLYVLLVIVICGLITFASRALPFLLFTDKRPLPAGLRKLADILPAAIMAVLAVYGLKDLAAASASLWLAKLIGIAIVVCLHLYKHNTVLSIAAGTAGYMLALVLLS